MALLALGATSYGINRNSENAKEPIPAVSTTRVPTALETFLILTDPNNSLLTKNNLDTLIEADSNQLNANKPIVPLPEGSFRITSEYGMRIKPKIKQTGGPKTENHFAIDLGAKEGTDIYAVVDGEIIESGYNSGYGYYQKLKANDGSVYLFAHLSKRIVKQGTVKQGQIIGKVGSTGTSTGPHLHYARFVNGQPVYPWN